MPEYQRELGPQVRVFFRTAVKLSDMGELIAADEKAVLLNVTIQLAGGGVAHFAQRRIEHDPGQPFLVHLARQTAEATGQALGGGLYVNYAFALVWGADVAWWWLGPRSYLARPRACQGGGPEESQ